MPRTFARFMSWVVPGVLMANAAIAHTSLGEYVQHRYILAVSSKNIDLTVELTFNGGPAKAERILMDTDKDGAISRDEQRASIARWEKTGVDQIRVLCNQINIPAVTLYAPDLDVDTDRGVGRHPVIVRMTFFARTPDTLTPGAPLRIESALQFGAPALVSLQVSGDAAGPVTVEPGRGDVLPALASGNRTFDVQCPKFDRSAATRTEHQVKSGLRPSTTSATKGNKALFEPPTKSSPGDSRHD